MEGRLACAGCEMGLSQLTVALKIETSRCEYLSRGWRAGNATERRGCCSGGCRGAPAGELRHLLAFQPLCFSVLFAPEPRFKLGASLISPSF